MNYYEYIKSEDWKKKSKQLKEDHPYCYCCGSRNSLQVHHVSYENLGNESDWDLKVLCDACHRKVHFTRKGKFSNKYPRTYKRVNGLRRFHIKYRGFNPAEHV